MPSQRLPSPGSDNGDWGDILNGFLEVEHNSNGSLKLRTDGSVPILSSGMVPTTNLGSGSASSTTYLRGDNTWATPAGGVTLDSVTNDIAPLGTQAAGSIGMAADAGHVHAMPRLDQVGSPTAAVTLNAQKITGLANGTAASDAATFGQIPLAGITSGTYAAGNDSRITGAQPAGAYVTRAAGTTATPASLSYINLADYGTPDGVTNNSAIILAAITAAAAGPRRLFIPRMPNPWMIGTSVVFPAGADIEIFGDGWGPNLMSPTIQLKAGLNDFGFKLDTTGTEGNHVIVRDLEIDGNRSQQTGLAGNSTGGGCFQAFNPVQCLFDHVHFHHAFDVALHLYGQQGSGPFGHHNRIVNSLFDNSAGSSGNGNAIRIQSVDENFIAHCDFETNGGTSGENYHIKDWSGINSFVQNVFVGGGEAVRFQNVTGSRFIGNMIDGLTQDAVHISGSSIQIIGNYFSGQETSNTNTYSHIYMDNGGSHTVTGNAFNSGTTTQGLRSFVSHQTSSTNDVFDANTFVVNGALGDGGVFDWNGSNATALGCIISNNIGLANSGGAISALTGDVTSNGSSNATTVVKINGVAVSGTAASGTALVATSSSAAAWTASVTLDTTDTPQPLGSASPGTGMSGAAPNDHVHAMPALSQLTDQDITGLADGTIPTWNAIAGKFKQQVPTLSAASQPLWQTLTSGITTLPRMHQDDSSSYSATPASGVEHFTYFRADKSMTVGHIQFQTGSVAAATSTYAAVGLYTVTSGTLTLVASCANQTTFTGTFASQTCALTASYTVVAGTIYAVGILQVATTPASILGAWYNAAFLSSAPQLVGTKSGQASLSSSTSSLSNQQFPIYYELVA